MSLYELENFSFTYEGEEEKALKNITLAIEEGGFYILCGRSGSGKSTLLKQLKSTLSPKGKKEGTIYYKGKAIEETARERQSQEIGFVFQEPENQIVTEKVFSELAFGLENLGYPGKEIHIRIAETVEYFGITDWFEKDVSTLSGGQKQVLNLASVLVLHPEVLLLDEPMAQLDKTVANDFFQILLRLHRETGMTILLSEHDLEDVFVYADKIFMMEKGELFVEGAPEEIGQKLLEEEHDLFLSMPSPLRISAWCGEKKNLPYTVAEGRNWLKKYTERKEKRIPGKKEPAGQKGMEIPEENVIEMKNVWFRYEKEEPYILRELSLSVRRGEIFALLGGNGTGKSTLLRLLAGFLPLVRGSVRLDGKDIKKRGKKELFRNFLGMLPQEPSALFVKDTVLEDLIRTA